MSAINQDPTIESYLSRLEALMTVAAMTDGFCDLPENVLQPYFSVAVDLIEKAGEANQASMSALLMER